MLEKIDKQIYAESVLKSIIKITTSSENYNCKLKSAPIKN